jgi:hypothetical protein
MLQAVCAAARTGRAVCGKQFVSNRLQREVGTPLTYGHKERSNLRQLHLVPVYRRAGTPTNPCTSYKCVQPGVQPSLRHRTLLYTLLSGVNIPDNKMAKGKEVRAAEREGTLQSSKGPPPGPSPQPPEPRVQLHTIFITLSLQKTRKQIFQEVLSFQVY